MHPAIYPVHRPAKYPGYWTIKKLRRWLRDTANGLLARALQPAPLRAPLDTAGIRRVIVCRRNNRLGNMLFLTPLLHSLAAALPRAEIDLLIGSADYSPLFQGLPGIRRVWVMPQRGWAWPLRMLIMLFQLRGQHYDLSVEPAFNSFGNRLSARLCGARWQLGFHTANQWLNLSHAVIPDPALRHEALKPQQLVQAGLVGATPVYPRLRIELNPGERRAGAARLTTLFEEAAHGPLIGFFVEATGDKRLPAAWWRAWLAAMRQSGPPLRLLQILPPGATAPLDPGLPQLCEPDLRRLAAVLGQLDLFISCDAGPMHLATAAGASTIGLFINASKGHRYRPLGNDCLALEVRALTPAQAAQASLKQLQKLSAPVAETPRFSRDRRGDRGLKPAHTAANKLLVEHQVQIPADQR